MGYPHPSFIALSISSIDPTPSSYARMASSKYGTSSRFTMNPVLSEVRTGTLPSFFFSSTFSMIASTPMSQSARSDLLVVPFSRARIASFCCAVIPPFSTGRSANFAKDFSIPANPLSRNFCSTSSTVTSKPAVAQTCAMPEPIKPQPRTPTFLISINTFRGHETCGLPRIMDNNLHWDSTRRDFADQIHKITSHLFRACADQVKIDNDQPIGNLHLINLTIRDAVIQGVEISPVPRWRADDAKERVIDVVIAVPCRSIHSHLHHEY